MFFCSSFFTHETSVVWFAFWSLSQTSCFSRSLSFFFSPFTSGSRLSYWWIVFVVTKKHLWQISPRFSFPSRNAHHPNDGGSLPNDGRGYGLHSLLYFWCDLPDPGLATEILEVLREKTSWSFFGSIGAETQLLDLGVWDKNGRCWGSETKKRYGESIIVMSCRRFVECQHIVLMEKDVGTASLPLQKTSSRLRAFLFWVQKNISWQLEAGKNMIGSPQGVYELRGRFGHFNFIGWSGLRCVGAANESHPLSLAAYWHLGWISTDNTLGKHGELAFGV